MINFFDFKFYGPGNLTGFSFSALQSSIVCFGLLLLQSYSFWLTACSQAVLSAAPFDVEEV